MCLSYLTSFSDTVSFLAMYPVLHTVEPIVPCRQRLCLCSIPFVVFAHGAFPAEMHHAQKLQKIFPVAEGDHAQGPSCSVEREYCPHCFNCLDFLRFHDDKLMFFDYTCSS